MKHLRLLLTISFITIITFGQTSEHFWYNPDISFKERIDSLVAEMTLEEKIVQLLNETPAIERLGVPEYNWWNEALHGIARNGKATIFPQGIAMGATFDPDLVFKVASAISDEARAKYQISTAVGNRGQYAGLTFWTPNVNIFRDPRWGRGQETYGEDPYLMSKIGVSFVKGLQGDHPKYLKTAACAKHFAVHSGPEELRHHFNAEPSKKDLYETYLPAFEALVTEAKVEGVMGAYNAVYGDPACASNFLMKDLLRDQWGFNGYYVSDCGALGDIFKGHQVVETAEAAAALALETGVNLNCGWVFNSLAKAIEQGLTTEAMLDTRLKELLMTRFKLGFFDPDSKNPYTQLGPETIHNEKHVELALKAAQKSIVLLKNKNNVLPLDKNIKVPYVTGPFASSSDVLFANYYGISSNLVTVLEGIADKVSLGTSLNYRMGVLPFQENINPLNWAPMVAKTADAVIAVVGISADMEGEEVDAIASAAKGDRKDLKLPQSQINYIKEMAEVKKGPLILVVASGSAVALHELYDLADAIIYMWYPGEQGGNAVADIIFGDVSPSGHLPITVPKSVEQLPPYEDYKMAGRTYKYMDEEPLFPFGFGLSYTSFEYQNLTLDKTKIKEGQDLNITLEVKNTGKMDAEDVVQVYLVPELTENLPQYALKAFKRIEIAASYTESLSLSIKANDLLQVDESGNKIWIKGKYKIVVSNSLPSEKSIELGAATPVQQELVFK